jgi:hypothetical protein
MTLTASRRPAASRPSKASRRAEGQPWRGPTRPYDLVKEFVIATVVVGMLVVALAALFGSPDEKALTLQGWAKAAPADFVTTTVTELDGSSPTAGYGPPYNHAAGGQQLGPLPLARWIGGYRIPVDTAADFVLNPLSQLPATPPLTAALQQWRAASSTQQQNWATAYDTAIGKAPDSDPAKAAAGDYGPVPALANAELSLAQAGGLDGALGRNAGFYASDYTLPLLFLQDGSYLADTSATQHLSGNQWGMMNETGSFPGQAWLWLYTFWYQISPFNHSGNGDALVWAVMAVLVLAFTFVPFLPGIRSLPRRLGVHRLIWRDWYSRNT